MNGRHHDRHRRQNLLAAAAAFALALPVITIQVHAQTYTVLHAFNGQGDGADPVGVTIDASGNLYGTTSTGGGGTGCDDSGYGCGTVFKLSHKGSGWVLSPLYAFHGKDGYSPQGRVVLARDGTLYGTTTTGGHGCIAGCGLVFHLTPPLSAPKSTVAPWNETIIYSFSGTDGFEPQGDLTFDQAGDIYGTTLYGGSSECDTNGLIGCGTVYALTPTARGGWIETVLYAPQDQGEGLEPVGGVVFDASENLYGAVGMGGPFNWGLIFQLSPSGSGWTEQPAYTFSGGSGGGVARAGLIADGAGNLYGTTSEGGSSGCGTVFQLTPSGSGWSLNTLYSFLGEPDGCNPQAKLAVDAAGSLYGTTSYGGQGYGGGAGTVFRLTPANGGWTYSQAHVFTGTEGAYPLSSLVFDAAGNLYGTTSQGGGTHNAGVVFEITP